MKSAGQKHDRLLCLDGQLPNSWLLGFAMAEMDLYDLRVLVELVELWSLWHPIFGAYAHLRSFECWTSAANQLLICRVALSWTLITPLLVGWVGL